MQYVSDFKHTSIIMYAEFDVGFGSVMSFWVAQVREVYLKMSCSISLWCTGIQGIPDSVRADLGIGEGTRQETATTSSPAQPAGSSVSPSVPAVQSPAPPTAQESALAPSSSEGISFVLFRINSFFSFPYSLYS